MSPTQAAAAPRTPTGMRSTLPRALLLAPAGLTLLGGLDAALLLLDVPAPVRADRLPEVHGVLLVLGFVGTVIALERAVALRHPLGFAAPASLGLGGLLLLSPVPLSIAKLVLVAGAAALVAVYAPLWRRQRQEAVLVQALGGALAFGAALLWLGGVPVPSLLPWLAGFIVLSIAGERLELARAMLPATSGGTLLLLACGVLAGVTAALLWPAPGTPLLGLSLLALTLWLGYHDVARRTIRSTGLTRYLAGCMLAAYGWLAVAAGIWLVGGPATEGARYDAAVHAIFLGFTFSMILAHAPVILPAVLRRSLPYHPALLAAAGLLHGSLVLRLWVGDALGSQPAWQAGGVLNIAAVVGFAAVAVWSAAVSSSPGGSS